MSDNAVPETAVTDREVQAQVQKVNQLLRELEQMVDDNQHMALTELFAERAVLAAMRARVELEEIQKQRAATGPMPSETTESGFPKIDEPENTGTGETKGAGEL